MPEATTAPAEPDFRVVRQITVTVLPLDDREEYERLIRGKNAYNHCSDCCGCARYVVGPFRVCSRHISRALSRLATPAE